MKRWEIEQKDVNIGFLVACKAGLSSFITLTYWVISYFFYDNFKLVMEGSKNFNENFIITLADY